MPIQERKISFGDPPAVHFMDILVVPKLLRIDNFGKVWLLTEPNTDRVLYKDKTDGAWEQIGIAPSENERELRDKIIDFIRRYLLDMYEEGLEMFDSKDYQFAIGPAIGIEKRKPYLLKGRDLTGIWYKQV